MTEAAVLTEAARILMHGQRGVVTAVDPDAGPLTVHFDGSATTVPAAGYPAGGGLDHGYALTVHQFRGMTWEQVAATASPSADPCSS